MVDLQNIQSWPPMAKEGTAETDLATRMPQAALWRASNGYWGLAYIYIACYRLVPDFRLGYHAVYLSYSLTPSKFAEHDSKPFTHHNSALGSSVHQCLSYQCRPLGYLLWFWLVAFGSFFREWVTIGLMRQLVALCAC